MKIGMRELHRMPINCEFCEHELQSLLYFSRGRKWNSIEECTVKKYYILKVNNALLNPVYLHYTYM